MKTYLPNNNIQRPALPDSSEAEYVYDGPEQETAHLLDYWKIVVKRRWLLIQIFIIFLLIGAYSTFTATPLYRATTTLKIEPANPTVTGVMGVGEARLAEGGAAYDYYQTQYRLLQSRSLAARVIIDLGLASNKTFIRASVTTENPIKRLQSWILGGLNSLLSPVAEYFRESRQDPMESDTPDNASPDRKVSNGRETDKAKPAVNPGLVSRYMSFLQLNPVKNTRLVEIAFVTPDPILSQKLADAHTKGFIRMSLESRFQLTKEAREFLDAKNAELKTKLEQSEAELNRFRQIHGVVSMDKGENIVVDRLVDLNRNLTTARAQRLEAESLDSVVQNKSTQYLSQVLTQGMIPNLRSTVLALEAEKIKQSAVFKPDHPRIIELNQQIKEATQSLNTEINNVVRGIRENYVAARAKEQALEAETRKQQQTALNLKEVGVQYAVLQEEVNVNKNLYDSILKRLNETNLSNDLAVSNMQITQSAERPRSPDSPNIPNSLIMYAVMGLFIGAGLAFFLEYIDSHLKTPDNIWRTVDLNTLGVVPDLASLKRPLIPYPSAASTKFLPNPQLEHDTTYGKDLLVSHHPLSIFSESYRTIRTALLFSQAETAHKVILLTSPSPGEGKTATTLNLGIALAQDGFKVVIIDADLRRGTCHTRFGIRNHRGLSDLLEGKMTLEAVLQETAVAGLSMLTRGRCPPNPSELLRTRKMIDSLTSLRESFDFILIDSSPAIAVSDPAILSNAADGVILVFHAKKTTARSARQVKERFDAIRAPIVGVILNGINVEDPDYAYYRHYYGSDYGTAVTENGNGREVVEFVDQAAVDKVGVAEVRATTDNSKNTLAGGDVQAHVFAEVARHVEPRPEVISGNKPVQSFKPIKPSKDDGAQLRSLPEIAVSGIVPQGFFDRMVSKLRDAAGPMAALILEDHISLLGEVRHNFPKSRLGELFDGVSEEIINNKLKDDFRQSMQEELRLL